MLTLTQVEIDGSYSETTRVSMWRVDEQTLNYDLVVNVIANLTKFNPDGAGGAVLVFLPGMGEIKQVRPSQRSERKRRRSLVRPREGRGWRPLFPPVLESVAGARSSRACWSRPLARRCCYRWSHR